MSVVATVPTGPRGPYTVADLDAMPDDGHRYEILDGVLLVTPSPSWQHQMAVVGLLRDLDAARPPGVRMLVAPYDVQVSPVTVLVPDLLAVRYADLPAADRFVAVPLLVVEVLSPGTAQRDRGAKKDAYERHGVPAYWIVDPDRDQPAVTVFELRDGRYDEVATVRGAETCDVTRPFPFRICPARVVAGQHAG